MPGSQRGSLLRLRPRQERSRSQPTADRKQGLTTLLPDCQATSLISAIKASNTAGGSNVIACPQDGPKAAGTPCRPAAAACDAVETCDGTSSACPTDGFLAAGTTCRAVAGPCDVAEVCAAGTPACPANGVKPMGTMCKAQGASATCDPTDFCDGVRSSCPASFAADGSTGAACAAPKSCNGTGRCL